MHRYLPSRTSEYDAKKPRKGKDRRGSHIPIYFQIVHVIHEVEHWKREKSMMCILSCMDYILAVLSEREGGARTAKKN